MPLLPPVRLSCCRCQLLGDGALPVQPLFELLDGVPAVIIFVLLRRIQEENNRMGGGPSLDQSGGGPFRAQCEIALHCQSSVMDSVGRAWCRQRGGQNV